MSLGKRPRPSMMRRTASMTEFAPGFVAEGGESQQWPNQEATPHPHQHQHQQGHSREPARSEAAAASAYLAYGGAGAEWLEASLAGGVASPRQSFGRNRRFSADFATVETAPFLRACGLCRRRLAPGRDIFMYRGDIAFCSLECRQQQINQDERKEKKCSLTSMKEAPPSSTNASDQSTNGETVAAA